MKKNKTKEIKKMNELVLGLTLFELSNKKLTKELSKLFMAIGDVFRMIKVPNGTHTNTFFFNGAERFKQNKELSKLMKRRKNGK